jgi:alkanesulfonate monooxygenase
MSNRALELLSSSPGNSSSRPDGHFREALQQARWAEEAGHSAFVIRSNNRLVDPWTLAQLILHETDRIRPVVTVQPLYAHPYTVAKRVASLASVYGRAPHLNLAAGAYRADLLALDDRTPHAQRYERLVEFGRVVSALLTSESPVVHDGLYYRLHKPAALPPLPASQLPRMFVCTSSARGITAAQELGATAVHHPSDGSIIPSDCVRIGVIAREDSDTAWEVAHDRFPVNPASRFEHRLDVALSDSCRQTNLQSAAVEGESRELWLVPFEQQQSLSAYVVGSHVEVARYLRQWMDAGVRTFVMEEPSSPADLEHVRCAFERAWRRHQSPLAATG